MVMHLSAWRLNHQTTYETDGPRNGHLQRVVFQSSLTPILITRCYPSWLSPLLIKNKLQHECSNGFASHLH